MKKFGVQRDKCTKAPLDLCEAMVRDCGHIQEMDAV